jgi:DNA helicase-2/ATP-dependent DNA helicase PcrA
VLIAGDDDQVVYAWQGADPNLLLDADRDEDVVLPNSYRLPSRVLNVVNQEIRHLDKRQEKDLRPRKEGGTVEGIDSPSMLDLARNVRYTIEQGEDDETIMVLFRARYQLFQFVDEFLPLGMPFSALTDQRMWTDRLTQYVRGIEALDSEDPLTGLQARRLADMLQDSAFGTNDRDGLFDRIDELKEAAGVDDLTEMTVDPDVITEFAPFAPDVDSAGDMLRKVTSFQRNSVEAYFDGEYQGMDPNRVRIGTIHSAKGREADHVFVATDLTEKVVEQMAASVEDEEVDGVEEFTSSTDPVPILTDNERRVFYVGMSRARERLVLLENLVSGAPTLPVSVLLHNEIRDESVESLLDTAQEGEVPAPEPDA